MLGALAIVLGLFLISFHGASSASASACLLARLALDMAACNAWSGSVAKASYSGLSAAVCAWPVVRGGDAPSMAALAGLLLGRPIVHIQ